MSTLTIAMVQREPWIAIPSYASSTCHHLEDQCPVQLLGCRGLGFRAQILFAILDALTMWSTHIHCSCHAILCERVRGLRSEALDLHLSLEGLKPACLFASKGFWGNADLIHELYDDQKPAEDKFGTRRCRSDSILSSNFKLISREP